MREAVANDDTSGSDRIYLELDGRRFPLLVRRRGKVRSGHTDREITELHAWATTSDPATHLWLSDALKRAIDSPVRATDENDEYLGRWTLSWNAYGEVASEHRYTLILRECEELNLEALVVDEMELHPYEYREDVAGGGMVIWAKVVGSEDDVLRLRRVLRVNESVPVVRRGIDSTPRAMRLGVGEWTEHEGRIKYRLALVEIGVDEASHPELGRIRRENNRAALGFYMNFAEQLVRQLVQNGVLSHDEVEAAREEASFAPVAVDNDFWRVVQDIDER
jgi:hypothetical protein